MGARGRAVKRGRMQRREVLELAAVAAGDGVLSSAAGGLSLACHSRRVPAPAERSPGWVATYFSREQAVCAEDLAELIIPEGSTPGAKSAGVAQFIESFVRDVYDDAQQRGFLDGLAQLDARAVRAHGRAFWACTRAEQGALLSALSVEPAGAAPEPPFPFVRSFRELCIRGFCTSKLGATRVLQYEPTPGEFQGCVPVASVGKAWATW